MGAEMKITKQEAEERIEGVLKAAGIRAYIYTNYGGVDIELEFPDGAKYEGDEVGLYLSCDGLSHQRG